jgi:Na+/melibiose symporter-like transporter
MLVFAALFAAAAAGFSDVVGLYMNTYFWEFSTGNIAVLVAGLVISVILAVAITPALTRRFDKKTIALAFACFGVAVGPLPVFLRLLDWMPENGDPLLLPIILIHGSLVVTGVIAIGILISSMIADAVDEAELSTGLGELSEAYATCAEGKNHSVQENARSGNYPTLWVIGPP